MRRVRDCLIWSMQDVSPSPVAIDKNPTHMHVSAGASAVCSYGLVSNLNYCGTVRTARFRPSILHADLLMDRPYLPDFHTPFQPNPTIQSNATALRGQDHLREEARHLALCPGAVEGLSGHLRRVVGGHELRSAPARLDRCVWVGKMTA